MSYSPSASWARSANYSGSWKRQAMSRPSRTMRATRPSPGRPSVLRWGGVARAARREGLTARPRRSARKTPSASACKLGIPRGVLSRNRRAHRATSYLTHQWGRCKTEPTAQHAFSRRKAIQLQRLGDVPLEFEYPSVTRLGDNRILGERNLDPCNVMPVAGYWPFLPEVLQPTRRHICAKAEDPELAISTSSSQ